MIVMSAAVRLARFDVLALARARLRVRRVRRSVRERGHVDEIAVFGADRVPNLGAVDRIAEQSREEQRAQSDRSEELAG